MPRRKPFKHHKREIWLQLCERLDADFFEGKRRRHDRIEAFHGEWMITLDTFLANDVTWTRMRAPYVNRDDFVFRIFKENVMHRIGKAFGMKDVEVGYPDFDKQYVIQGSDERKLRMMFANPDIRDLISFQYSMYLALRRDAPLFQKKFPKGVNEVYYQSIGTIANLERLHDLFELFAATLDHLCAIGTAYEDDPEFRYY
ncbi:MAG: DUF3137 domain-containing protein [Bacteroidota bacterium]